MKLPMMLSGGSALTALALLALAQIALAQIGVAETAQAAESVGAPTDISPVLRRLVSTPTPSLTVYGPPPDQYVPLAGDALTPTYVEPVAPALIPPPTVVAARPAPTTTVGETVHTAHAGTARPPAAHRVETAARRVAPPRSESVAVAATEQPLALSAAQRQLIYRTLAYAAPPRVPLRSDPYADPYAPPTRDVAGESSYPLRSLYPADNSYHREGVYTDGDPFRAFASQGGGPQDETYRANAYQAVDRSNPYHPGYRQNGIPLMVGARIPAGVWLGAIPTSLAARVPAVQPYSYAVIDNRLLLVDPTGIIVATIAP